MEERDQIAGSYANSAMLANTVLLLLNELRRSPESQLSQSDRRSLRALRNLLSGTANGAKSRAIGSDLSPVAKRSLTEDLRRYHLVSRIKEDADDQRLENWTREAANLVQRLEQFEFEEIGDSDRRWISTELEPFLDELSRLDGAGAYEDEFEIQSEDIAAA